ncbi:MAG: 50S ribosomal protein L6 [Saprospiraceae bacterium]|jgi:large subunit ribosomal protein L6|uniref:Large ribosomal subunit protein uL6 n=1 Tax=Candidatus Defluviibacterium haderslevense TaxID=2981993 RepID=A0A9D7XGF1_9BACT|nr:50S ribosomal protein L6 [Candidatus Defluviibacterium haderslevense]MBP8034682.1 50S ribosomal protein L6 [Bacteroidia bacterium]MCC7026029.1 50S ribosomal protein L6 [Saprospiraceae bacterium]MBK7244752.1 50S ribosomal protein L6 [Candidatus Defluviibacterium haderslevense]MBK8244496.1 50S ribosomal protein L6 [Candidatus Defluviibacterium haderslevense]
MSRIGKKLISLPAGVEIKLNKNTLTAKGPNGTLTQVIDPDMGVDIDGGVITITRPTEQKRHKSMHGLTRSLVSNLVTGVSTGFTKEMELVGVGYRVSNVGNLLELSVGYSHPIMFYIPDEVNVATLTEKGQNPKIILKGSDKQLLGQICAKIRAFKKPEPFKGKGIKFVGEIIRRKAGKSAGKK